MMILLLAACGAVDPKPTDPAEEATGLGLSPDPTARLVAWGEGGVFLSDPARADFGALTEAAVGWADVTHDTTSLTVAGGGLGDTAERYLLDTGARAETRSFTCGEREFLASARLDGTTAYGVCVDLDYGWGAVVRADADGSTTTTGVGANRLVHDAGALHLLTDLGREGGEVHVVDPVSLADTSTPRSTGFYPDVRAGVALSTTGEAGNSDAGTVLLAPLDGTEGTEVGFGDGVFPVAVDRIPGGLLVVDLVNWPDDTEWAVLADEAGDVLLTLDACRAPTLVAPAEDTLEAWCLGAQGPLTQTILTHGPDGWSVGATTSWDLDVVAFDVIEQGD